MRTHPHIDCPASRGLPALAGALSALGAAIALVGCAVGPHYVKPAVSLNQGYSAKDKPGITTQAEPDTAWWRGFNDPTLDQLIELAYRQNLPLQIAGVRIMEARAQLALAVGQQWPQVQAVFGSANAVGLTKNLPGNSIIDRYFWDYQIGFDAAWELDFWKKYGQNVEAQTATYFATVEDYDNGLVSLTAEVARTYALIRTFEVLIQQAHTNVTLQEDGLRIAQSRFRNGATSELDVSQASTLLENTRTTIPQLEIGLQQAQNGLCTLLGQPTGTLQSLLQSGSGIPTAPANVAISIPAELLRRRPDVRSAELLAIAQCDRIGVARADLFPSFSLVGAIGYETTAGATTPVGKPITGGLFDPASLFYSFGPRLLWPLFNYGRIHNNVRLQDARLQELLIQYQNTALQAAEEVENGLSGYLKSQEATASAQNAATAAQRSVDLAFIQYREGAVDFQRVLDAQRSLLEEQNLVARSRSDIATNLIALYKALGGGWELRRDRPFVADSVRIEMQNRTNWGDLFSKQPSPHSTHSSSTTP